MFFNLGVLNADIFKYRAKQSIKNSRTNTNTKNTNTNANTNNNTTVILAHSSSSNNNNKYWGITVMFSMNVFSCTVDQYP